MRWRGGTGGSVVAVVGSVVVDDATVADVVGGEVTVVADPPGVQAAAKSASAAIPALRATVRPARALGPGPR